MNRQKILIVEDDVDFADLVKNILESRNYLVTCSYDGKDALRQYTDDKNGIGLVFLDIVIPRIRGDKLMASILEINPEAKVLICTGHNYHDYNDTDIFSRAKGVIKKPFGIQECLEKVHDALEA